MKIKTELFLADDWNDYELLDSGNGRKWERFGSQRLIRPDPQAFWQPATAPENWQADAVFDQNSGDDERGHWRQLNPAAPEVWPMQWENLRFHARRSPFRHVGLFQEHSVHWRFARKAITRAKRPISVLNLFGYTGMMSLACAAAGAEVTHLDASPKSNGYGKDNQALSGLADKPIRWIADDAMKFAAREVRRGNQYDAIVLDPPKFGRGTKNETWRFEEDLPALLQLVRQLLSNRPLFIILTAYAVRLSHIALAQTLEDHIRDLGGELAMGEMALPQTSAARLLPTAICARWQADELIDA